MGTGIKFSSAPQKPAELQGTQASTLEAASRPATAAVAEPRHEPAPVKDVLGPARPADLERLVPAPERDVARLERAGPRGEGRPAPRLHDAIITMESGERRERYVSRDRAVFQVDDELKARDRDRMGCIGPRKVQYFDASRQRAAEVTVEDGKLVRVAKRHGWHADDRRLINYRGIFSVAQDGRLLIARNGGERGADGGCWNKKHSTMVGGEPVLTAGEFETDDEGNITLLNNNSGHYQPSIESLNRLMDGLREKGLGMQDMLIEYVFPGYHGHTQFVRLTHDELEEMRGGRARGDAAPFPIEPWADGDPRRFAVSFRDAT